MSFTHQRNVKARKDYSCEWCLKPIPKGVVHVYEVGVFDGDFFTCRFHGSCHKNTHKAHSLYLYDCFDYECTYDYLKERAKEENPELLEVGK
jgi:hypothetical protein